MPTIEEIQAANAAEAAKDPTIAVGPDLSGKVPPRTIAAKEKTPPTDEKEEEESEEEENPLEAKGDESGEEAESEEEGEEEEEEEAAPKPKAKGEKTPWYQRRINELTAKNNKTVQENEVLKAALAAKGKAEGSTAETGEETEEEESGEKLTEAEVNRRAEAKAAAMVIQREFVNACNKVYDSGLSEFGSAEWKAAKAELDEVGGIPIPALEALLESEFPHRVLHALSKDKDEASRIFSLPPLKMAVALSKIEGTKPKVKTISKAAAPIVPIKGKTKGEMALDDPNLSTEEFAARRDKEVAARRAARLGRTYARS